MWDDGLGGYDELGSYEVGQVCENGHAINGASQSSTQLNQKFCEKCGSKTITACPSCEAPIRGIYRDPTVLAGGDYFSPPAYCHNCGNAFPWTALKIETAIELLGEELPEEVDKFRKTVDDIVGDTPRTQLGVSKFNKLMMKAGKETANAMRDILVDIVSETARKAIWGN